MNPNLYSSLNELLSIETDILRDLLPKDKHGDEIYALILFIRFQNRAPSEKLLFNDVLYKFKFLGELNNPLRIFVTDKEYLKLYVKAIIGDEFNVPTLKIIKSENDFLTYEFPESCVIKPTHASNHIFIRRNSQAIEYNKILDWLKLNYYLLGREVNYKNLIPKIIVEPIIFNEDYIKDYKFFCYKGQAKIIQVDFDRYINHTRKYFDTQWNELSFRLEYPRNEQQLSQPKNLPEMLNIANQLSHEFNLVRIDLYTNENQIYVGEITSCHGNATERFGSLEEEIYFSNILFGDN